GRTSGHSKGQEEYTGTVTGHYQWGEKPPNKKAEPSLGHSIKDYAWSDGKRHVSIYITLPGLDAAEDRDLKLSFESREVAFAAKLKGEMHIFEARQLLHDISAVQLVRKKKASQVVLKLRKQDDSVPWSSLISVA
ncbi:unnamed protein product, partial [Polarella glacialis]